MLRRSCYAIKKKADIVQTLVDKRVPTFVSTTDADEAHVNYDYLLKMDLYHLTREEVELLQKRHESKLIEVTELEKLPFSKCGWMSSTILLSCIANFHDVSKGNAQSSLLQKK